MLTLMKQASAGAGIPRQLMPNESGDVVFNLRDQSGSTGYAWHIRLPRGVSEHKPVLVSERRGEVLPLPLIGEAGMKQYRLHVSSRTRLPVKVTIWQQRSPREEPVNLHSIWITN